MDAADAFLPLDSERDSHAKWAAEYDTRVLAVFLPDEQFARLMGAEVSDA